MTDGTLCRCPPSAAKRCGPDDEILDLRGRQLCCPHDEIGMARYYGETLTQYCGRPSNDGRKAAMRKRRAGVLEEIAQRAADTRWLR